jgi:hypothetical protein
VLGLVPELLEAPELFLRTVYIGAQQLVASLAAVAAAAGLQAATTGCSRVRFSSSSSSGFNNAGENKEQQLD